MVAEEDVVVEGVRKVVRHGCSVDFGGDRVRTREKKKVMGRSWLFDEEGYYNG